MPLVDLGEDLTPEQNQLKGSAALKSSEVISRDGVETNSLLMPAFELDAKFCWALYAVYAAIGTVNGFFATYLFTPIICQYIFGPLGEPPNGYVTQQQCTVAPSIFQISWNFKIFVGFFLDNITFFGSRRRGWLLFGWTGGLIMLAFNAIMVQSYINNHDFNSYIFSLMGMCCFYTISDVAGDGLIIELSKFEPDNKRGFILTTCQMVRFTAMLCVSIFGLLFMSGPSYQNPLGDHSFELSFEISFPWIHWCLLLFALPSYALMWLFLRDPPVVEGDEHCHAGGFAGMGKALVHCFEACKSYAMFMLLIQVVGLGAFAFMQNPSLQLVAMIADPASIQSSLGAVLGTLLLVAGMWVFRTFLISKNWRITLVWTYTLVALANLFSVMVIGNTFGISQNGWFYMLQTAVPSFVQGLSQVLSCLAVVEISPPGLEATIYEMLISAMNGANSLASALGSQLIPAFNLGVISQFTWSENHCASSNTTWSDLNPTEIWSEQRNIAVCNKYDNSMNDATYATLIVNIVSVFIFAWFMPMNATHCREWAAKEAWKRWEVGVLNLIIFIVPFVYATYGVFNELLG